MAYKRSYNSSKPAHQDNSAPETIIPLDTKKRVTVRKFNNVNLVDIREFYTDANGDAKPGKKGISLTEDTYYKLIDAHNKIEHALDALNGGGQRERELKKAKVEPAGETKKKEVKKEEKKNEEKKTVERKDVKSEPKEAKVAAGSTNEAENDAGDGAKRVEDVNDTDGDFVVADNEVDEEEEVGGYEEEVSDADE
ncbi:hypothetical protein KGF57_002130 [Candida theae]|uniref:Transcriptional coactivator p15 (PC4) C-terminal domain-containing protein n=1 Tax=Candida theae TaxID=1198502 RepID=A0AAD5BFP3_9ASCO|nr:uncharacterized protein KGF57_002130 [Candida theae]KAI5959354.1 hypothetical protein KGF57_002130 [Candida theae]